MADALWKNGKIADRRVKQFITGFRGQCSFGKIGYSEALQQCAAKNSVCRSIQSGGGGGSDSGSGSGASVGGVLDDVGKAADTLKKLKGLFN